MHFGNAAYGRPGAPSAITASPISAASDMMEGRFAFEWQARSFRETVLRGLGPDDLMKPVTNGIGTLRLLSLLASVQLPKCRLTSSAGC
jgi:hypothetical protein